MLKDQWHMYPVYRIPRPVTRYRHNVGDPVRLRSALGKLNNSVMEPVVRNLGRDDLTVEEIGNHEQVRVSNVQGSQDIVPSIWLIPSSVTDIEDYPPAAPVEETRHVVSNN